jgi:hypothetical protein
VALAEELKGADEATADKTDGPARPGPARSGPARPETPGLLLHFRF